MDENNRMQMIYTDSTGRFPKTSQTGMNYVLVLTEIDSVLDVWERQVGA